MFLDIDGNKVFTLDFGSGPRTFLALSGWIGNFEDWIATLAPLSRSWRTVVYDHRGAGETVVPPERISPEALVDDVFAVMDRLGIERCVLAGFSRGTVTAMRAVLARPERFDGLMLLSGCGEVMPPGAPPRPLIPPSSWPGASFADHLGWFADRCLPETDSAHIRRWGINILSRSTPEVADRIFTMQPQEAIDWAARLPGLNLPTLLVHGEKDAFYPLAAMRYVQSLIPGSRLDVLDGVGHLPGMTRPHEVAGFIDDYFEGKV